MKEKKNTNTSKVKKNAIYYDKTQEKKCRGKPVFQATKQNLTDGNITDMHLKHMVFTRCYCYLGAVAVRPEITLHRSCSCCCCQRLSLFSRFRTLPPPSSPTPSSPHTHTYSLCIFGLSILLLLLSWPAEILVYNYLHYDFVTL